MTCDVQDMDAMSNYEIVKFQCGVSAHSELTILCYGKRFNIQMSADNLHGNLQLEMEYLERLHKLEIEDEMLPIGYNEWQKTLIEEIDNRRTGEIKEDDNDDDDEMTGDAMEELCFWIAINCNPFMQALGSDSDLKPATVEQWLYPETLVLVPKVGEKGNLKVESSPASDEQISDLISSVRLPPNLLQTFQLPLLHPSKIFLSHEEDEDTVGPIQRPEKVFITPGEILFFKPCHRVHEIPREIQTLALLQRTGLSTDLRVPTLHGLVQYQQETDQICGLLLTYVKHEECLSYIDTNETPLERRKKWISQIRHTISNLHSEGIVWGDVKPDNILIDENDDLWFVDFGGSFTHEWVDEDKAETVEGDCQGMNRIIDFLFGEYEAP